MQNIYRTTLINAQDVVDLVADYPDVFASPADKVLEIHNVDAALGFSGYDGIEVFEDGDTLYLVLEDVEYLLQVA